MISQVWVVSQACPVICYAVYTVNVTIITQLAVALQQLCCHSNHVTERHSICAVKMHTVRTLSNKARWQLFSSIVQKLMAAAGCS